MDELKQVLTRYRTSYQVDSEGNLEHLEAKKPNQTAIKPIRLIAISTLNLAVSNTASIVCENISLLLKKNSCITGTVKKEGVALRLTIY